MWTILGISAAVIFFLVVAAIALKKETDKEVTRRLQSMFQGPIRHPELSPEQIRRIREIKKVFGDVDTSNEEQTIDNFKRDANPDTEIAQWERMANAYTRLSRSRDLTSNEKLEAFSYVLTRASCPEEDVLQIRPKHLTNDDIRLLMQDFGDHRPLVFTHSHEA